MPGETPEDRRGGRANNVKRYEDGSAGLVSPSGPAKAQGHVGGGVTSAKPKAAGGPLAAYLKKQRANRGK
jgi:hypothetical protein